MLGFRQRGQSYWETELMPKPRKCVQEIFQRKFVTMFCWKNRLGTTNQQTWRDEPNYINMGDEPSYINVLKILWGVVYRNIMQHFFLNDLCLDTDVRVLLRFPQMVAYTSQAVQEAEQPTNRLWRRMETTELGAYGLEMRWSEAKFRNRVPLWEPEVWTWFRDVRPSRGSDTKSTAKQTWHNIRNVV